MTDEHMHYSTRHKASGYESPFWHHSVEAALHGKEADEYEILEEPCNHGDNRYLRFDPGAFAAMGTLTAHEAEGES